MNKKLGQRALMVGVGLAMFAAGWLAGKDAATTRQTIVHAASWTALPTMTQKDLDTFRAETAALVGKVPGLKGAWVGKLREPVTFDGKKRDHGIVLEFDSVDAKNAYSDKHPMPWYDDFNKLREQGSSNFDTVGNSVE